MLRNSKTNQFIFQFQYSNSYWKLLYWIFFFYSWLKGTAEYTMRRRHLSIFKWIRYSSFQLLQFGLSNYNRKSMIHLLFEPFSLQINNLVHSLFSFNSGTMSMRNTFNVSQGGDASKYLLRMFLASSSLSFSVISFFICGSSEIK